MGRGEMGGLVGIFMVKTDIRSGRSSCSVFGGEGLMQIWGLSTDFGLLADERETSDSRLECLSKEYSSPSPWAILANSA